MEPRVNFCFALGPKSSWLEEAKIDSSSVCYLLEQTSQGWGKAEQGETESKPDGSGPDWAEGPPSSKKMTFSTGSR